MIQDTVYVTLPSAHEQRTPPCQSLRSAACEPDGAALSFRRAKKRSGKLEDLRYCPYKADRLSLYRERIDEIDSTDCLSDTNWVKGSTGGAARS